MTESKIKNDIFPLFLPPGTTDAAQHVDNNNGQTVKHDLRKLFQNYLTEFKWEQNPQGKLSAKERRKLTAGFINTVARDFETNHPGLVASTALHCGM